MEEEARWDDSSAEASMTVSAEPWRCPCGIPPENHHICSAGTCWWCLADRVKAQSDAEDNWQPERDRRVAEEMAECFPETLAQSDAEPVAWEYRTPYGWHRIDLETYKTLRGSSFELRPIFAPPRPDASAGLIEAADLSDVGLFPYQQDEHKVVVYFNTSDAATRYGEYLKGLIRARAADRSGK